ncbi:MAG TPA: TIR domain-containing protein [Opitutaceae bacterium]|nr:TIR domain-containing protein [Opitutaceae bacterium]
MDPEFKYWAFISYCHEDKNWARWLHRAVETYPVPRALQGRATRAGPAPRRFAPVFRDREELSGAPDLNVALRDALKVSRYLIVVCSPGAAKSTYVDQEIRIFKSLGREDRVFCVIVSGEPNATDRPGREERECYPAAVRFRLGPEGGLSTQRAHPLSPDARPGKDGRQGVKLKLLAGLLGVGFDDLARREWWRGFWWWVRLAAGSAAVIALVAGVWQRQEMRRAELARHERIAAYTEAGRKELLEDHPDRALAYLSAAYDEGGAGAALRFLLRQADLALPKISSDRHTLGVFGAAFSPDAARVVTASEDHSARIWNAANGRLVATLDHPACVNSATYSPDGRWIVTACDNGTASLWDAAATGKPKPLAVMKQGEDKIYPAIFNARGDRIATSSQDGTTVIWDAASHVRVASLPIHEKPVNWLEFSPDQSKLVTASDDNTARISDAVTGHEIAVLGEKGGSGLRFAGFSPDSARVVTGGRNGEVRLWRVDGSLIANLPGHTDYVRRAAFSPDGKSLVTASADGTARVWNGETGELRYQLSHASPGERKTIYATAFSPDGRVIATAGADGSVKLWEAEHGRFLAALDCKGNLVYGVEFSRPDGKFLSVAGDAGLAAVWSVSDAASPHLVAALDGGNRAASPAANTPGGASLVEILPGHSGYVGLARFSPDSRRAVTVGGGGRAHVWDSATGRLLGLFASEATLINDAGFNGDGKNLVVGNDNGSIAIWDVDAGRRRVTFPGFSGSVRYVRYTPDQRWIAATGEERTRTASGDVQVHRIVRFFGVEGGAPRLQLDGTAPGFSADGRHTVTLQGENRAQVWDGAGAATATLSGHTGPLITARFSYDGQRIVTASDDHTAIVWRVDGHRLFAVAHARGLYFATFSPPDDRRLVTLSSDNTARVWDGNDGRPIAVLEGEQRYIASAEFKNLLPVAAFSPDGELVTTQSHEPRVKVWEAASGRLLMQFLGHEGNVSALAFSRDGSRLLTGAQDGTARMWDVAYETRPAAEISQFVRDHVAWRVDGDNLLSAPLGRP